VQQAGAQLATVPISAWRSCFQDFPRIAGNSSLKANAMHRVQPSRNFFDEKRGRKDEAMKEELKAADAAMFATANPSYRESEVRRAKDVGCPTSDIRYQSVNLRGPTFLVGDGWLSIPERRVCFLLCARRLRSCICPLLFCHKTWTLVCDKCACPC
jgi:hypothetical protein